MTEFFNKESATFSKSTIKGQHKMQQKNPQLVNDSENLIRREVTEESLELAKVPV